MLYTVRLIHRTVARPSMEGQQVGQNDLQVLLARFVEGLPDFLFARFSAASAFLISIDSVLLIWRRTSRHERSDLGELLPASVESLPPQRATSRRKPKSESFHELLDRRNGRVWRNPRRNIKDGGFRQQNGLQQALESGSPNVSQVLNLNPWQSLEPWDGKDSRLLATLQGSAWAVRRLARPLNGAQSPVETSN
jgi:hypothetical protein